MQIKIKSNLHNKKYIFSFWGPMHKNADFLRLCVLTWKKFLSEYDMVILEYQLAKYNLEETLFQKLFVKRCL